MTIINWRKLIFGLVSILCITVTEISMGWTKTGAMIMGFACMVFYGPPLVDSVTKMVRAWKGRGNDN